MVAGKKKAKEIFLRDKLLQFSGFGAPGTGLKHQFSLMEKVRFENNPLNFVDGNHVNAAILCKLSAADPALEEIRSNGRFP